MSNALDNPTIIRQSIEERIGNLVCYIEMQNSEGSFTGSGFVYQHLEVSENDKLGPQWRRINGSYIVTNRHVVFGLTEHEEHPTDLTINLRAFDASSGSQHWHALDIDADAISKSIYVHENADVDIAIVDVSSRIKEILGHAKPLSNTDLIANHPMLSVECTDDIIVVGFPRGFYDRLNHFPIIKQGIIASAWDADFEGERFFLIDAKLFPGSSGSVVVTKPVEEVFKDGQSFYTPGGKQYSLLGVFSGEPFLGEEDDPEFVDVGIVWYADLIDPIIERAKTWSPDDAPSVSIGSMSRPLRRKGPT